MSNSARPHRRQPATPHLPWDSPGKNTGVGCYVLLQCMKVKSESEVAQSCRTLSDPMDCSPPGSSIHGIFQARVLEWCAIAFSEWRRRQMLIEEACGVLSGNSCYYISQRRDFPSRPVVKTPHFYCRGLRFNPWLGN